MSKPFVLARAGAMGAAAVIACASGLENKLKREHGRP